MRSSTQTSRKQKSAKGPATAPRLVLLVVLALVLVFGLIPSGVWLYFTFSKEPLPFTERCTSTLPHHTTVLDPEQAYNAGIIAGVSIKRKLKPRAASIALATAYQESGIRNLDYGHSDSVGLFQQRTSQGWGSIKEIMDPWYSSKEFYKALVRVRGWETGDINDTAQAVQRSGYPEAYRKHEENARTLASALTGETPATFNCELQATTDSDILGMKNYLTKTFGKTITVTQTITNDQPTLSIRADSIPHGWAVSAVAIAGAQEYGLVTAAFGDSTWQRSGTDAGWRGRNPTENTDIVLEFGHK